MEMNHLATRLRQQTQLSFEFGTFEGFNFRDDSAIERCLSAQEVIEWNHDEHGEAEFWPSGDNEKIALLFRGRTSVCGSELAALNDLLSELQDDCTRTFLRIHYLVSVRGEELTQLTREKVEDLQANIYEGKSFLDLRREAAYELFELYYPELYEIWEKCPCDGLVFDTDLFLDSPSWTVEEVEFGEGKAIVVIAE
jgi:hypothetical protein